MTNNITEQFVSFETAKLLKEKGFDEKCYNVWACGLSEKPQLWAAPSFVEGETMADKESVEAAVRYYINTNGITDNQVVGYLAPTHALAMKWLRDTKNLVININYIDYLEHGEVWYWEILDRKSFHEYSEHTEKFSSSSYEEACEESIRYCLENLVEPK